jgi:hypothetical protein
VDIVPGETIEFTLPPDPVKLSSTSLQASISFGIKAREERSKLLGATPRHRYGPAPAWRSQRKQNF